MQKVSGEIAAATWFDPSSSLRKYAI